MQEGEYDQNVVKRCAFWLFFMWKEEKMNFFYPGVQCLKMPCPLKWGFIPPPEPALKAVKLRLCKNKKNKAKHRMQKIWKKHAAQKWNKMCIFINHFSRKMAAAFPQGVIDHSRVWNISQNIAKKMQINRHSLKIRHQQQKNKEIMKAVPLWTKKGCKKQEKLAHPCLKHYLINHQCESTVWQ